MMFAGGVSGQASIPLGSLAPRAFTLPQKSGGIAALTTSKAGISPAANLIPARNLVLSESLQISGSATLQLIVSLVANATGILSVNSSTLAGAANLLATASGVITTQSAICGAIVSALVNGNCTIAANAFLTAIASMEAEAGGPTPLSPEGLASAVLDALLADHVTAGTVGEALNSIGAASNPWSADLSTNKDPGTFGEHVQKLLTLAKYLGLK